MQDFDPKIQFVINRIQSFEKTREVFEWARKYNYSSINIDLIYGLPHQTVNSVVHTINLIKSLMPDRIAFYSYAHVPGKAKPSDGIQMMICQLHLKNGTFIIRAKACLRKPGLKV